MVAHKKILDDREFIRVFENSGAKATAVHFGMTERAVYVNRRRIEEVEGVALLPPRKGIQSRKQSHSVRKEASLDNGMIVIFSDAHFWPGLYSTAYYALLHFLKKHKKNIEMVVCNGDALDGAKISRHPPTVSYQPELAEELETVVERMSAIKKAAACESLYWPLGNHDARLEVKLASHLPELRGVRGTELKDHIEGWEPCMSLWINDDIVIKHRWKGGVHATHNNAAGAGKTMVTGHLHSLKVTPYSDYNGVRYGVDTGTLAEPYGPQFAYGEDNPSNHRSGFAVLTIEDGELRMPELVQVVREGFYEFRGKSFEVSP